MLTRTATGQNSSFGLLVVIDTNSKYLTADHACDGSHVCTPSFVGAGVPSMATVTRTKPLSSTQSMSVDGSWLAHMARLPTTGRSFTVIVGAATYQSAGSPGT